MSPSHCSRSTECSSRHRRVLCLIGDGVRDVILKVAKETLRNHQAPEWLSLDAANLTATIATAPSRDQMPLDLNEQLVVEYYSR